VEISVGKIGDIPKVVPSRRWEARAGQSGVVVGPSRAWEARGCRDEARARSDAKAPAAPPPGGLGCGHRRAAVRVLVAIEERHRIYRDAIGRFLEAKRPGFEVRLVAPRGLYSELRRFGPQIVLYAGPPTPVPDLLPCWIDLALEPSRPTVMRTGGIQREVLNPSLSTLLALIDEAVPVCP